MCVCVCVCASTAPGVFALGWVKCREQNFTAGYTLYEEENNNNNNNNNSKPIFFFTKPITDYGKMLKYQEKYRSTDIWVDLYRQSHHKRLYIDDTEKRNLAKTTILMKEKLILL